MTVDTGGTGGKDTERQVGKRGTFRAHKAIVTLLCESFTTMLGSGFPEGTGGVLGRDEEGDGGVRDEKGGGVGEDRGCEGKGEGGDASTTEGEVTINRKGLVLATHAPLMMNCPLRSANASLAIKFWLVLPRHRG